MSTPENPPKLWVFDHRGFPRAHDSLDDAQGDRDYNCHRSTAPIVAYVREDVAEQAHDIAMAVAAGREDALRRERDALAARVEKLTGALGTIKSKGLAQEGWIGYSAFFVAESALKADADAAGKGVR